MKVKEMLAWTKRLKEVQSIKDGYLRGKRMQNLWSDFREAYDFNSHISSDPFLRALHATMKFEYFKHV